MNLIYLAIVATVSLLAYGSSDMENSLSSRVSKSKIDDMRKWIDGVGGCNVNVCFAIDGSGSISPPEFAKQKDFVLDVVSVISVDQKVELAAVQYGLGSSVISALTTDVGAFILSVDREPQLVSPQALMVGGIDYCLSKLYRRRREANKMVVLGDGRSFIGSSSIAHADVFRSAVGGEICAVGAGFKDNTELLAITGGKPSQVFNVNSFLDVLALEVVLEKLVLGICGTF